MTEVPDTLDGEEKVVIRLKFLNETERDVEASLVEKIGAFKRRNFTQEILANKIIRLIFNGKVLKEENHTLQSYGLFDKCVVHCLIHQQPQGQQQHGHQHHQQQQQSGADHHQPDNQRQQQRQEEEEDFDLSDFFIPILGAALVILWYFAFTYSTYFNFMSTSALIGLTSLYFLSVYGTHFHVNVAVRTG
jgi:hypothetical protein